MCVTLLGMAFSRSIATYLYMCYIVLRDCSFWSYHLSKQAFTRENDSPNQQALKVLLCGGLAGVVTWASIFPLGSETTLIALSHFANV